MQMDAPLKKQRVDVNETTGKDADTTYDNIADMGEYNRMDAVLKVSAGAGDTMTMKLEHSADGVTWFDHGTAFTGAIGATTELKKFTDFLPLVRWKADFTAGGVASPVFKYAITVALYRD